MLVSGVLIVLVAVLHHWLVHVGPLPGDRWSAYRFSHPWTERAWIQHITHAYELLATPGLATALCTAAGLWLLWRGRWPELAGLAVACSAVAVNAMLKQLWGPTPLWVETFRGGANFPSGHTTYATAVIGYLGVLAYRRRRPELVAVAVVIVLGMGPARVISGAHLVSDTLAGYMLGGAFLLLATVAADRAPKSRASSARERSPSLR